MTAQEIFDRAMALVLTEGVDKAEYQPFFIRNLNILLAETFARNNAERIKSGLRPLSSPPIILNMTDTVPYEKSFTDTVLPFGVAGRLWMDDDRGVATELLNKYEYLRASEKTAVFMPITNVY